MSLFRLPVGRITASVFTSPHPTPDLDPLPAILTMIDGAKEEILVAVYSFTLVAVADALIAAHDRGVTVLLVADATQLTGVNNQVGRCVAAGIQARKFGSMYHLQHEKAFVVDADSRSPIVAFGSMNATTSGESSNQEILLVARGAQVARVLAPTMKAQIESAYVRGTPLN